MSNVGDVTLRTEDGAVTANITDPEGDGVGGLDVYVQDQYTGMLDLLFMRTDDTFTLAIATVIDEYTITVTGGHTIATGETIMLREGVRYSQFKVLNVVANVITLDAPLDVAYTTSATGENGVVNMNVDGSVTPQTFCLRGQASSDWDIVRVLFAIETDGQPDSTKFGDIAGGLTQGMILRYKNSERYNIFNVKTNGEFALRMYDISYDDRSAPTTDYFFRARRTFGGASKTGVVIRLFGSGPDEVQLIIQDDLTGLTSFFAVGQGHLVE